MFVVRASPAQTRDNHPQADCRLLPRLKLRSHIAGTCRCSRGCGSRRWRTRQVDARAPGLLPRRHSPRHWTHARIFVVSSRHTGPVLGAANRILLALISKLLGNLRLTADVRRLCGSGFGVGRVLVWDRGGPGAPRTWRHTSISPVSHSGLSPSPRRLLSRRLPHRTRLCHGLTNPSSSW